MENFLNTNKKTKQSKREHVIAGAVQFWDVVCNLRQREYIAVPFLRQQSKDKNNDEVPTEASLVS